MPKKRPEMNNEGYTYISWVKEVEEILLEGWNIAIREVKDFNPKNEWSKGTSISSAVKICTGNADSEFDNVFPSDEFFIDDFPEIDDFDREIFLLSLDYGM